jgi:hypothetical protein
MGMVSLKKGTKTLAATITQLPKEIIIFVSIVRTL